MTVRILQGDMRGRLAELADESIDAIVTDPPYHLTTGKKGGTGPASLNENSPAGRSRIGTGFMGKRWDGGDVAFQPATWARVLRVAKPGAHLLAFGGSRTSHRLWCAVEDAGWEIRDTLMWLHGEGFPKSSNQEGEWEGWGTALKPAHEEILWATKPFSEDHERHTIVENLSRLGAQLWSLLPANVAVESFRSSLSEYGAACVFAQWSAEEKSSTRDVLCALTDTSRFVSAVISCSNTVRSWRNILAESSGLMSTFTIGTESGTTINWRTLKSCSSVLTPRTIIEAEIYQPGSWWRALPAARILNAAVANIESIRELSVLESAMCAGLISLRDVGERGLSPNVEPILLARKPLIGTVAENLRAHGVGALNIDACRVPYLGEDDFEAAKGGDSASNKGGAFLSSKGAMPQSAKIRMAERWPANVLHDGSDEVIAAFPDAPGQQGALTSNEPSRPTKNAYGEYKGRSAFTPRGDSGSASRFFWCPKASRRDRNEGLDGMPRKAVNWSSGDQSPGTFQSENTDRENENFHPTVKPTELMRYLIRLVTPRGGVVLDPFMGSGSTGKACEQEGMSFVGIELEEEYVEIAKRRVAGAHGPLFA